MIQWESSCQPVRRVATAVVDSELRHEEIVMTTVVDREPRHEKMRGGP